MQVLNQNNLARYLFSKSGMQNIYGGMQNSQNYWQNKRADKQQELLGELKRDSCSIERANELRAQIRKLDAVSSLNQQGRKEFVGESLSKENGIWSSNASEEETDELEVEAKYNYKDVSSQIQRAKNSVSASKALLSARRKVLEIRRKMANKNGDAKELQLALTHAKRMEMVARKKKHNLEVEELIENTQKLDERMEKSEDFNADLRQDVVAMQEEKVRKLEDEVFEDREETFDEYVEEFQELGEELTEDELAELNQFVSEMSEEVLEELEESMELLEEMEVVDPHMSEEDLSKLKQKHRSSEGKDMVKADMDYLKSLIKYETVDIKI